MAIFERISRIIKANINWMLDKSESPEQELHARITELEKIVFEGRESVAMYGAAYRKSANELDDLKVREDSFGRRSQQAFDAGDEQQARKLIAEKIKISQRIGQLNPGVQNAKQSYELLMANIVKLQQQLKDMQLELRSLKARKDLAAAHNSFDKKLGMAGPGEYNERMQRLADEVAFSEAEVDVRAGITGENFSDMELEQRCYELQIEAEMQALRKKGHSDD